MYLYPDKQSPYYQIIYFVDGKRTKKSTKKKTESEAQIVFEQFKKEFTRNSQNIETVITKSKNISLSQFYEEYKFYVSKSKSKHYQESIRFSFNQFIDYVGSILLSQVTTKLIDQFVTSVYSRSESAASLYFRTLKAAFGKAVVWEYIPDNPFKKIKPPKVSKSFPVFISENELIEILNNTKTELLKNIFSTAYYTGMRLAEILNMKWSWIDFNQSTITVKNSKEFKSKSKRERIIPIHPKVKNNLQSLFPIGKQSQNELVFYLVEGIKLNEDFVSKQFKKAVRKAELNDAVHFHTLRHSFASALVQRGVSLYAVKELLGHEDIKTTQIYSHLQNENLSQAVNLL
jgi:site-specific recombinase XerD